MVLETRAYTAQQGGLLEVLVVPEAVIHLGGAHIHYCELRLTLQYTLGFARL
jgi:hypothetical protein